MGCTYCKKGCHYCGKAVDEDDTVWVDPETGEATTGDKGEPYHISCAPAEARDGVQPEEDVDGDQA